MKTKKIVILNDDEYAYDYIKTVENGVVKHELYYSNGEQWRVNIKGKLITHIIDDGNDLILNKPLSKKINYADANCLKILLNLIFKEEKDKFVAESTEN